MSGLRRRIADRRPSGDGGTSLMELMVGMVIMTILMAICTAAIVTMFAGTGKTQAVANSAQQLNTAFMRLDRQVRYATAIDPPRGSMGTNDLSVSFLTVTTTPTATSRVCSQLSVQTLSGSTQQQLVERSWGLNADGSMITGTVTPWAQLATGVSVKPSETASDANTFYVFVPAGGAVQQLRIRLTALDSTGQTATNSFSEISFSASNSAAAAQTMKSGNYVKSCSPTVIS